MNSDEPTRWNEPDLPEVARILRDLINAPSPNPPGDCERVAEACRRWLEDVIPTVEVVRSPDGTPSVIGTMGSGERTLLVHSHYDTQPVSDYKLWTSDPYKADLRDGVIFGRGAGDDKGSVAAQMAAALVLARTAFDPGYVLKFAFVADEESGGERGTQFLKESGYLDADAIVIGEQTNNEVAIGERGIVWIRVGFHGRPAHGAIPSAGASALIPAARFVDAINTRLAPELERRQPTPLLPHSSINVGRLVAGNDVSTVPDTAVVEIDRRIVPGETPEACEAEIRSILGEVMVDFPEISTSWSHQIASPAFLTDPDDDFVGMAHSIALQHGAGSLVGYDQASDARFFADDGIPIVIFGPSDPKVGHAAEECVSIEQLVDAQEWLVGLCQAFAKYGLSTIAID